MNAAADGARAAPAERVLARLRGDLAPASLPMAGKRDAAEYLALRGAAEFEAFHARIALAERAGAIAVERDRHRDDGSRLRRITAADVAALAADLGTRLLEERVAAAAARLQDWTGAFPVLGQVLEAWRAGRSVRGQPPEASADLADAARVVLARREDAGHERIVRRESARLFGSGGSKRLEGLTAWLDLLVTGELAASGLEKEHVWSALGLRRAPQPMLVAGVGSARLEDGALPLRRPYLGLPVESLCALETPATRLLTVENLASFHDAARVAVADPGLLLLYTGGMPSPVWRRAYARILAGLAPAAALYHWGDIDEGGFRIAAAIAAIARAEGRRLAPWRMRPDDLPADVANAAPLPPAATLAAMCRWAGEAGWDAAAQALRARPLLLEQESLEPVLPR